MDLSVVVAGIDAAHSIASCLQRLERACVGLRTELLVISASADDTAEQIESSGVAAKSWRFPPGTLAPQLWAAGYRQARGRVVAFTTGHCLVSPDWARALVDAIEAGAAAAGGPLVIAAGARRLDWAVFYLRYSAFTPETLGAGRIAGEIAGDNAAYRRAALDRHADALARGFWEIDVHKWLRADGGWLVAVPSAVIEIGRSFSARTILRHRFLHGQHSGAGRRAMHASWRLTLASPAVPLVLAVRAARRVWQIPADRRRFVAALPWFLVLAAAWAAGEGWGAVKGPPHSKVRDRGVAEIAAGDRAGEC